MPININISRDEFLANLAIMQNVTGKKVTIAILSNVLIETGNDEIFITGTDLEVGIRIRIPAEILSPGSITLPSRKLFEIVRESDSDLLKLEESDNNWVNITAESSNYRLAGMPSEEYPAFPEYNEDRLIPLPAEKIKLMIDKTLFSIAAEADNQFTLAGALIEKEIQEDGKKYLKLISSDGHRLSYMQIEVESDIENLPIELTTIIPRKGVHEIRKFSDMTETIYLGIEEKKAIVKNENGVMVIRLMAGDFPNYKNILKAINREKFVNFDRIKLLNSMKRMNLFSEDLSSIVKFNIYPGTLVLSSQNMDIGSAKDEISIVYEGEPFNIGFNGRYFVDTLSVMKSNTVKAYISTSDNPCLICGDDDEGFLSMIMPMDI